MAAAKESQAVVRALAVRLPATTKARLDLKACPPVLARVETAVATLATVGAAEAGAQLVWPAESERSERLAGLAELLDTLSNETDTQSRG